MVSKQEYFQYSLRNGLLNKKQWYYCTMTIPLHTKNEYFEIKDNRYYVYMNGKKEEVKNANPKEPLFDELEPITLFNADLPNIEHSVDTTIGKAIYNYLCFVYPFKDKIPYKNDSKIKPDKIEKELANLLSKDKITVKELHDFGNACSLLQTLFAVVTISATKKTMTAPPGIKEFKKKLMEEFNKKYGKNWVKDPVRAIEFQNALIAYDDEYLKDDPSNGKMLSGKAKGARGKMYLAFGQDVGLKEDGELSELIPDSLDDGYPMEKKHLTTLYNSNRAGSFARGNETKDGGVAAKNGLRATTTVIIDGEDCNASFFKNTMITKENLPSLAGRYYYKDNKLNMIDDNDKFLIGKEVKMRSPLYCNSAQKIYCTTCCGNRMRGRRNGIVGLMSEGTGKILNNSMKMMHKTERTLVNIDIRKYIF